MEQNTHSTTDAPVTQQRDDGPCPACDDEDCDRTINIIGDGNPIHESEHPEVRAERARERRNSRHRRQR